MLVKDSADFMDDITRTEVADFLYSTIVDNIADELREQEGMQNNNALMDLGDQVANGVSVYWDVYLKTVEDMTVKYLDRIPEKFLWAMWQDGRYIDNIVDDENDLDNIPLQSLISFSSKRTLTININSLAGSIFPLYPTVT